MTTTLQSLQQQYQRVSEAYDKAWNERDIETVTDLLIQMWKLEDELQRTMKVVGLEVVEVDHATGTVTFKNHLAPREEPTDAAK